MNRAFVNLLSMSFEVLLVNVCYTVVSGASHESPSRAALEALVRNFADVVAGRPARSQEEIDAEAATFSCRAEQKTRRLIAVFLLQDFTRLSSQVIQS